MDELVINIHRTTLNEFYSGSVGSHCCDRIAYGSSVGFGWVSGSIGARDRGASSSDLNRDFNFTSGTGSFVVDVPNGT